MAQANAEQTGAQSNVERFGAWTQVALEVTLGREIAQALHPEFYTLDSTPTP